MTTGVIIAGDSTPIERPRLATISATSPRQAMPTPTWMLSRVVNWHALAPRPQPRSFEMIETSSSKIEKTTMPPVRPVICTLIPMLAKNTGVSRRYPRGLYFVWM